MLHHLEAKTKKGKEKGLSFKALTFMRNIAADWKDGIPPDDSYSNKEFKVRSNLDKMVAGLPKRTVPHSKTQMLLVRSISQALVDDRYEGQKSSMFGSKDFE
jgi:hypothetical protein